MQNWNSICHPISLINSPVLECLIAITVFEDWLAEVSLINNEITADLKRIADFTSEHIAKKQRTEISSKQPQYNIFPHPNLQRETLSHPMFQTSLPLVLMPSHQITTLILFPRTTTPPLIVLVVPFVDPTSNTPTNAHIAPNYFLVNMNCWKSTVGAASVAASTLITVFMIALTIF